MADLKDMEGPIKFKKGVELYYDPKKDMFYDEKKKKYVKEKDIIKMVESSEDGAKTLNMEDDLNLSFSKMFDLYKEYQTKRIFEKIKSKKKLKDDRIEEGRDEEYEKFFQSALKKFGVSSPSELKGDKKKEFFDYIDKNWEGENEEDEEETIEELNIGMSFAGNGLSVYDRDRESSGDYMKIAHVQGKPNKKVKDGDDITLNIYDKKKSNHKAIIAKVEKSFPKSKIKVDDRSKMKMTQEETIEEKKFKPHMMYDPKTGKAYKAEKPEDHERMSKLGYTHEKPKKIEELSIEERYDIKTRLKVHKAMMKKYGNDPYYKQVIDAILSKGTSDMEKAIKSLISIRGAQALKNLQSDMKSMLGETVEESRIRLSSLMNGGALLYDRDEDPDDDKLATVKVKGNPKKDIKNGDDLVLSLMDKGKSKEKEILKSLKKYYPKSKVVKEENIEEVKMHPALKKLQTALKKFHKGSELDDLVPEYGAKIVDGKKVYHIEYKKGKKEGEEFAKSLQKALKASSFSVTPTYRGDDSVVSIEIKEETISPKIAAYLNFLNKNLEEGKKDYEIYHNTFSSAIDEVKKFAKKNGYELDDDDLFHKVGTGPKKPSTGKTNKYHLKLIKGGKENKKLLHFQVYGMKSQYELNMYIS